MLFAKVYGPCRHKGLIEAARGVKKGRQISGPCGIPLIYLPPPNANRFEINNTGVGKGARGLQRARGP